ncbi:MAG: acetyl-CoA carboxylase, biotin carboxyl carrier protein [Clostridia bacterium]|nr:acetyl-CoA carboxylase, biotin carboxyl carrier protein [Clostridia bacterium]
MKESDIRKYATMMQEFGLTGIEVTEDNKTVRLERNVSVAVKESAVTEAPSVTSIAVPKENGDYVSVKSPIVGVFYTAPAENAEPYVSIGDRVKKGQTICIVEAMKLMNEIAAEEDGVIAEICATNGQVVEFGTELFRIKR